MDNLSNIEINEFLSLGQIGFWKLEIEDNKHPRLYANSIMDELVGSSAAFSPEQRFDFHQTYIHPDDRDLFNEYAAELLQGGSEIVYRYIHPTKGEMNVRCNGRCISSENDYFVIVGYHQVISDIVRLEPDKLIEKQLAQKNESLIQAQQIKDDYYKNLLDLQSCGVISYTLSDYKIIHMNAEALRVYGVKDVAEAQANLRYIFTHTTYPDQSSIKKLKELRNGSGSVDYECIVHNKCGQSIHILAKTQVFITPNKERFIITTFMDMSENITLHNAIEEAKKANVAKTNFLRRMSHDIRTPINGIMGVLEIAAHYENDIEKQRECRNKALEASGYLLDLVNNILDMNKLESGSIVIEHKPFDLDALIQEVENIIEMNAQENAISVSVNKKAITHTKLVGSPLHLRQILLNVMGNAVKYNKPHGTVTVTVEELPSCNNKAIIRFICSDTGYGMSEEFQKQAFEPFSQENNLVRTSYAGSGLGLSIAQQLTKLMNGTISLQSSIGTGTTFSFVIPFDIDEQTETQQKATQKLTHVSLEGANILVVEDNDLNRDIACFVLAKNGANTTEAKNGYEALKMFENSEPYTYDVILMDVMMPVMDGLKATKAIRSLPRKDAKLIPIIAMTANAFQDDIAQSLDAGMNEHLSKPLQQEKLIECLKRHLR